jgi:hypothetical protein
MNIKTIMSVAAIALMVMIAVVPFNAVLAQNSCNTVVVTDANPSGWAFQVTSPDGIGEYQEPAPHKLGQGSAYLFTGTHGDESARLRNSNYNGTALSSLTKLKYCTFVKQWNGQQAPYLILNVDTNNDGTVDEQLFFEPPYQTPTSGNPSLPDQGSVALNTWQCWDAFNGGWYGINADTGEPTYGSPGIATGSDPGVLPLSGYIATHPNAVIRNTTKGGIQVLSGFASETDVFESYVDAFTIGTTTGCSTFDFEKFDTPTTADQCKKGGWQTFNTSAGRFKNQGDCIQFFNTGK